MLFLIRSETTVLDMSIHVVFRCFHYMRFIRKSSPKPLKIIIVDRKTNGLIVPGLIHFSIGPWTVYAGCHYLRQLQLSSFESGSFTFPRVKLLVMCQAQGSGCHRCAALSLETCQPSARADLSRSTCHANDFLIMEMVSKPTYS